MTGPLLIATVPFIVLYVLGGFIIGATLLVAGDYFRRWRRAPAGSRLVPLHVWALAVSYDLLVLMVLSRTDVFTWRALVYGPAIALGFVGVVALLHHQRKARRDA